MTEAWKSKPGPNDFKIEVPGDLFVKAVGEIRIHLLSTIEDWCNENFGENEWGHGYFQRNTQWTYFMFFRKERDAILFKTFWT